MRELRSNVAIQIYQLVAKYILTLISQYDFVK